MTHHKSKAIEFVHIHIKNSKWKLWNISRRHSETIHVQIDHKIVYKAESIICLMIYIYDRIVIGVSKEELEIAVDTVIYLIEIQLEFTIYFEKSVLWELDYLGVVIYGHEAYKA